MSMKRIFLTYIILAISTPLIWASQNPIDSLKTLLSKAQDDTNKVNLLNQLAHQLHTNNQIKSGLNYLNQSIRLGKSLDFKKGVSTAYNTMGAIYYSEGNYFEALTNFNKSMAINMELGDSAQVGKNLNNIGVIFRVQNNLPEAVSTYFRALSIYKVLGDKKMIAIIYNNLGIIYRDQANIDKALEYYNEALAIFKELDDKQYIGKILNNVGNLYRTQNENDKAIEQFFNAIAINEQTKDYTSIGFNYNNLGIVYSKLKDYHLSAKYYRMAIYYFKMFNDSRNLSMIYNNIGESYFNTKQYNLADLYLDSAYTFAQKSGNYSNMRDNYQVKYRLDSVRADYHSALINYQQYILYRDKNLNEENTKQIVASQMNYQFQQQISEEKAKQAKLDAVAEVEKKRQQMIKYMLIAGFLLAIVFAILIFKNYRKQKEVNFIISRQKKDVEEKNILIEQQKNLVEQKNKDITDSIHYASRIQQALLSTEEIMKSQFQDSFVFFKPRDIVSGDFYWTYNNGDKTFLACCDCTGHGVPGAFMSLLNISLLNESIIERKIERPDMIFNNIREGIINALNPKGSRIESKDGMDATLLAIDKKSNTIQFACANNPIWIIKQNGDLIEIKPDKMPIGVHFGTNLPFTLHQEELQKGDTIYLFSDGYADQFGGPNNKKFKYNQLKELFIENVSKSMGEQHIIIENTFNQWKGIEEQIDDVCVIGIRI